MSYANTLADYDAEPSGRHVSGTNLNLRWALVKHEGHKYEISTDGYYSLNRKKELVREGSYGSEEIVDDASEDWKEEAIPDDIS